MIKVNVFEIKARLSHYLDRAVAGEHVVICRHNHPVAELRAVAGVRTDPRPTGPLPGRPRIDVPGSFFEPLSDDILQDWEGRMDQAPARSKRHPRRVAEKNTTYPASKRRR